MMTGDMLPKAPIIETKFWVEGDELDPDEFTHLTGLQPTRKGKKGELSLNPMAAKRGVRIPATFWVIEVERNTYSMDEGIQEVLGSIWPHRERILEYAHIRPSVKMGVTSVIHYSHDPPAYEVSRDSIEKLAYLGCEFGMGDIYKNEDEGD